MGRWARLTLTVTVLAAARGDCGLADRGSGAAGAGRRHGRSGRHAVVDRQPGRPRPRSAGRSSRRSGSSTTCPAPCCRWGWCLRVPASERTGSSGRSPGGLDAGAADLLSTGRRRAAAPTQILLAPDTPTGLACRLGRDLPSTPTSGTYMDVRYQQVVLPRSAVVHSSNAVAHRWSTPVIHIRQSIRCRSTGRHELSTERSTRCPQGCPQQRQVFQQQRRSVGQQSSRTGGAAMRCPFCRYPDSRVIDSREVEDGQAIRRRRSCPECSRRFTTLEGSLLSVVKRSGVTEPFSRSKVIAGVTRACQGRPVDADAVAQLAQQVEETVRGSGQAEVPSQEVGLAILGPVAGPGRGRLPAIRLGLPLIHLGGRFRRRDPGHAVAGREPTPPIHRQLTDHRPDQRRRLTTGRPSTIRSVHPPHDNHRAGQPPPTAVADTAGSFTLSSSTAPRRASRAVHGSCPPGEGTT